MTTPMRWHWRQPAIRKLWMAWTISQFGSKITYLALPLTAALALHASPLQMGLLALAESAPVPLAGLVAGVWVDRLRRRPLLVVADLGRALLLLAIPLSALLGWLRLELLYLVALLAGLLTTLFDVAHQSLLPRLVRDESLVTANGALEVSSAVAEIAGPGLAGALVQLVTAPVAILADALSFLVSGVLLIWLGDLEPARHAEPASRAGVWGEIRAGLRVVLADPVLRPLTVSQAVAACFANAQLAVYVLFVTRELGIGPALLGAIYTIGSGAGLVSATLVDRLARRWGPGTVLVGAQALKLLGGCCLALAGGAPTIPLLVTGEALFAVALPLYNVTALSLRQALVAGHLQGRVNASVRALTWGALALGALLGGALGSALGLRATLLLAAVGLAPASLVLLASPVRAFRAWPVTGKTIG